ncbi:hypothetical protein [Streptomyces sp. NPDC086838]|uniref:hypothetical protein n=1 Tax=Streptomyces sp. NPDC086838 TaxID=3365762 RepID=UPI0037FA82BA
MSALLSWSDWGRRIIPGRPHLSVARGTADSAGPPPGRQDPPPPWSSPDHGVQPPDVTRTMLWLLLSRDRPGPGVDRARYETLVAQWNRGFTPVVPRASPRSGHPDEGLLAHALRGAAGQGRAWWREGSGPWLTAPAAECLLRLGVARAPAGTAVAGDFAGLAEALHHFVSLRGLVRAIALGTRWMSGASGPPAGPLAQPLGQPWTRRSSREFVRTSADLLTEEGVSLAHAAVHGGRLPVGHVVRQWECLHRAAFLAERQQAFLCEENGGARTAARATATAHLRKIRAHRDAAVQGPGDAALRPADTAEALDRAWRIVASLLLAVSATLANRSGRLPPEPDDRLWRGLAALREEGDEEGTAAAARWLARQLRDPPGTRTPRL